MNKKTLSDKMVIDIPVRIFKSKYESEEHYYIFPQLEPTNKSVAKGYLWFDSKLDHDVYDVEPVLAPNKSYLVIKTKSPNPEIDIYIEPSYSSYVSTEKDIVRLGVDEKGRLVESNPNNLINDPNTIEVDVLGQK